MAFFGNLFRRKEPTASSGDTWKDTPWPDGPSFLGAALLLQFIPEDRQVLTDLELANLTAPFAPGMRKLVELWIVVYVTWLMRILVDCKIDDDFSDDGVRDAITNPRKVGGGKLAAVHRLAIRFLTRDSSSPFHGDENPQFDGVDIELAGALEEAKNISKARIDNMIAIAKKMPR
jgi:hypothetical protein